MVFFRLLAFLLIFSPQVLQAQETRRAPDISIFEGEQKSTLRTFLKTNKVAMVFLGEDSVKSWKALSVLDALFNEFQYRGSNLVFLPYVVGKSPEDIASLSEDHWLNVPLLGDPAGKIAGAFQVGPLPRVVLVDPLGQIFFEGAPPSENEMRKILNTRVDKPVVKAFCPVDKMWVVVTEKTPSVVYKGDRFYFCTPEDHDGRRMDREFLLDPDRYAKEAKAHVAEETVRKGASKDLSDDSRPTVFQCPMMDAPAQNKPGRCLKCGMLLEKVEG